jgi:murein DD-endopeptidase MepM/ murein hydrolase activator NlpD
MGACWGRAATRRGRVRTYATGLVRVIAAGGAVSLALAGPAGAQEPTGGTSPEAPQSAPRLSPPPFGVKVRPAPVLHSWRCIRACQDTVTGSTGSLVRVRGRALGRTYEVVFLGAEGAADDVAAAPLRRKRNVVDVRVPLGAVAGPLLVARHDGERSATSATALAIAEYATLKAESAGPTVEVQVQSRRAFFDAELPARASYVVHGAKPANVVVELVRAKDGVVVTSWQEGEVAPETPRSLSWDGTVAGKLQPQGRYAFRVTAVDSDGVKALRAQAPKPAAADPSQIQFLAHEFPIRGPHYYGESAARFGGGRGHQGHDTFAACGTPVVAARGGVVQFKQYHSAAGHYLVIDGERTGVDYTYMHLREAALVDAGERVRTGQLIGYVGQTGRASGCHLHFEMWSAPGWYDGGKPFDPLPSLLAWDKTS